MFLRVRMTWLFAGLLAVFCVTADAQSAVSWTTNYFSVTGDTIREIRQSIRQTRPWKEDFDGITTWDVRWKFQMTSDANGCRCTSFATTTTITTSLPRWKVPANASPETIASWTSFFLNLAEHELGHARIAHAAAAEVQKRGSGVASAADCAALTAAINAAAEGAVSEFKRREKEYDERTHHGMASFTNAPPPRR